MELWYHSSPLAMTYPCTGQPQDMHNSSLLESARVWWLHAHKLLYRSNEVHLFNTTFSEPSNLVYLREDHRGKETLECGKPTGWNSSSGVKNVPCPVCCVGRICAKMWENLMCVGLIYLKTACYCRHRVQVPLFKWVRRATRMTVFDFRPTTLWWWWWNGCLHNIDSADFLLLTAK